MLINVDSEMTKLCLTRVSYTKHGTFGVLLDKGIPFCVTLERPWLDNRRNVSCIPFGIYTCKRIISPKFGDTFEVLNVPGRSHILFHKGNLQEDTHGCILVGEYFDPLNNEPAILASGKAFQEFRARTARFENDKFQLVIGGVMGERAIWR